jgi:hypothetical protein
MNYGGLEFLAKLEQDFAKSKIRHLKGSARVRLSSLVFYNPFRPIDTELKDSLKRDFKAEGCLQHEIDCSIPALIDNASFLSALEALNVSAESFKSLSNNHPTKFELPANLQLKCLHGQHRIAAAAEYLPYGDKWWLVDIYGEGQYIYSFYMYTTSD